jgi:uncharacterized protein YPO0396
MLASDSFHVPELEGRPNLTALDVQITKLRDSAVASIREMAKRLKEEATDVIATLTDIEDWLERLKQLAEEVRSNKTLTFSQHSGFNSTLNIGMSLK